MGGLGRLMPAGRLGREKQGAEREISSTFAEVIVQCEHRFSSSSHS